MYIIAEGSAVYAILLTFDCGIVKIKHFIRHINRVIEKGLDGLYQSEDTVDGKIQISVICQCSPIYKDFSLLMLITVMKYDQLDTLLT